jgi:NADH-quinone oxidoreductase subunit N
MLREFLPLLPEMIVLAAALALLPAGLFVSPRRRHLLTAVAVGALLSAALLSLDLARFEGSVLNGMFVIDSFGIFAKIILLLGAALAVFMAGDSLGFTEGKEGEYLCLLLLGVVGMMTVTAAGNLLVLVLGVQLASLPLYVLAGFRKYDPASNEAALKYFILGLMASAVTLYGVSLAYGLSGTLDMADMALHFAARPPDMRVLSAAIVLILAGLSFKVAAVPFHFWAPDTYEGAPTPVTALIAAVPKAAGFAALVRVALTAFPDYEATWAVVFAVMAVLTMTLGNLSALSQVNIKRLLAYSGIAHVGYMLVAVTVLDRSVLGGLLFYLGAYAAMNLGAFAVVLAVEADGGGNRLDDFSGLGSRAPLLAGCMTIFLVSMVGFPGTAGFMGKLLVFGAAVRKGYLWLALVALANSVVSVAYYFGVLRRMYLVPAGREGRLEVPSTLAAAVLIALFLTLFLGLYPEPLLAVFNGISLYPEGY